MHRQLRRIVPIITVFAWAILWRGTQLHWLGDTVLAGWFHHSGRYFAEHGWESYGLPMYPGFTAAYTHITPGPDWIQGLIAIVRPARVDEFSWHSLLTAGLSLMAVGFGIRAIARITSAWNGLPPSRDTISVVGFLILTSGAIQVFSPQPYSLGTLLADVVNLYVVSLWCIEATPYGRWSGLAAFSIAFSFWMGLTPILSSACWLAFAAFRFGDPHARRRRLVRLGAILALTLALSGILKLWQNYAYLGSWHDFMIDTLGALRARLGLGSMKGFEDFVAKRGGLAIDPEYDFSKHVVKLVLRTPYLFGALSALVPYLLWRGRHAITGDRVALTLVILAGLAWQIGMRHHAYHHIYLFRFMLFPLALLALVFLERERDRTLMRRIVLAGWLQLALLWGIALIPSIR